MASAGTLIVNILLNSNQFTRGIQGVTQQMQNLGRNMQMMGMAMTAAFTVPIVAGFTKAAQEGLNFNATLELLQVAFTNTMGSAELAKTFLDQLMEFSGKTPFDFEGMAETARMMNGMGIPAENLYHDMVILGDQLAYLGRVGPDSWFQISLAMSQIRNSNGQIGQEIRQLVNVGVDGYAMMAKALNVTKEEAIALADSMTGAEIYDLMMQGMEMTSKGSAIKLGETWSGAIANIKENVKFALADIFKPLFDDLKPRLEQALETLKNWRGSDSMKEWAEAIKNVINDAIKLAEKLGEALGNAFKKLDASGVEGKEGAIKGLIALAGAGPGLMIVGTALNAILTPLAAISTIFSANGILASLFGGGAAAGAAGAAGAEGGAAAGAAAGLGSIVAVAVAVIAAITAIGVALYQFWQENEEFRATCEDVWNDVMQIVTRVADALKAVWETIGPDIMDILSNLWDFFKTTIGGITEIVVNVIGVIADLINGDFAGAWDHVKGIIEGFGDVIWGLIGVLASLVGLAIGAVVAALAGLAASIVAVFKNLWTAALNLEKQALQSIMEFVTGVYAAGAELVSGWISSISTWASETAAKATELKDSAIAEISTLAADALQAGIDFVQGLINGIDSMVDEAILAASKLASAVANAAKGALGIESPSRVMFEVGQNVVQGLANGIYAEAPKVDEATQAMIDAVKRASDDLKSQFDEIVQTLDDGLQTTLAGLDLAIARLAIDKNLTSYGREAKKLDLELAKLNTQSAELSEQAAVLNEAMAAQAQLTGENSTEYKEYSRQLADVTQQQAMLQIEIEKTNIAIQQQAEDLRNDEAEALQDAKDLMAELTEAEKQAADDRAEAAKKYADQRKEVETQLAADVKKLWDDLATESADIQADATKKIADVTADFEKALADRAKSLYSFTDLFSAVSRESVSGDVLLSNLRGQVSAFDSWQSQIATLAARGIDGGLLQELRDMGPKALDKILALNSLTDGQLTEYVTLWKTKSQQAKEEAAVQLEGQRLETQAKIAAIRADTAAQLETIRTETFQKMVEIQTQAQEQLDKYEAEWKDTNKTIEENTTEAINSISQKFMDLAERGTAFGLTLWRNFNAASFVGFSQARASLEAYMAELSYMVSGTLSGSGITPARSGPIPAFASGGFIAGTGLALVHAGEFVLNARAFQALGDLISSIGSGGFGAAAMAGAGGSTVVNIYSNDATEILRELRRQGAKI